MSALEQFLMELLLAQHVDMLRAEAEVKARVLAILVLMQRDIVSLLANAPELSMLGKAGKNALLRESNELIASYYGKAQLELDLAAVAEVEALGVQSALAKVIDLRPGAELPTQPELKAALTELRAQASAEAVATSIEIRLGVALPTENYLRTLASDALIQGSPAKNWWLRQTQDTQFKLANEIRIGSAQGETNAQIIKRIVGQEVTAKAPADGVGPPGVMPLARRNAAAVVQTAMAQVAADARRATFQANRDITRGIIQHSTLDSHTSLTCLAYDGATWDLDYEPIDGNDLPYDGGVPRHFNCLPGDAFVLARSAVTGVSKRWFDGEIVVIRTAGGRELTSTPNHPILTSGGWVAARLINVGGDVVCDGGSEWEGVGDGNHEHVPSRIEDEFSAFFAARKVLPVPVPLTAEDFHGDGGGSKIAVIWTESFLRGSADPTLSQHLSKDSLVVGPPSIPFGLEGCGHCNAGLNRTHCASHRIMGSLGECSPLVGSRSCHPGELLGASVAGLNAVATKNLSNTAQGDSKFLVDSADANAGLEQADDIGIGCASRSKIAHDGGLYPGSYLSNAIVSQDRGNDVVANTALNCDVALSGAGVVGGEYFGCGKHLANSPSKLDTRSLEYPVHSGGADAELVSNILSGNSGAVFLDDVVSVTIRSFSGHVYNLETVDGWYSANGIVTHNCRSSEIAMMKTLREMGIDMDEPDPGMRASSSGPISAKTTFSDFLKMKGEDYQNETLGKGRAAMFRDGKLSPRDLVDMSGQPLKLSAIRAKYAQ